jgi:hypothetical protein
MKAYGGMDIKKSVIFLTSTLVVGEWSASRPVQQMYNVKFHVKYCCGCAKSFTFGLKVITNELLELYNMGNYTYTYILWHVNSLLGNDREISSYTTAVAK